MSRILLNYHTNIKFYTQYTHPTLICRGTDGRTENIYSIFRDKLLLLGEHLFGGRSNRGEAKEVSNKLLVEKVDTNNSETLVSLGKPRKM